MPSARLAGCALLGIDFPLVAVERTKLRQPVGWCRWSASDKPDFLWDFRSQCFPVTWPAFSFLQSVQGLQASSQSVQYPAVSFPPQHLLPVSATQQFPMVPYFMCATFPPGEHVHQFYYLPMQGCVMLYVCPGLTVKGREWGSHSRTLQPLFKIMVSILSSVPCLLLLQSGTILRIYWLNRDWMSWEFEVRNRETHELGVMAWETAGSQLRWLSLCATEVGGSPTSLIPHSPFLFPQCTRPCWTTRRNIVPKFQAMPVKNTLHYVKTP